MRSPSAPAPPMQPPSRLEQAGELEANLAGPNDANRLAADLCTQGAVERGKRGACAVPCSIACRSATSSRRWLHNLRQSGSMTALTKAHQARQRIVALLDAAGGQVKVARQRKGQRQCVLCQQGRGRSSGKVRGMRVGRGWSMQQPPGATRISCAYLPRSGASLQGREEQRPTNRWVMVQSGGEHTAAMRKHSLQRHYSSSSQAGTRMTRMPWRAHASRSTC